MPDTMMITPETTATERHPRYDHVGVEERLGAQNYRPLDVVLTRGEGI